MNPDDIAKVLLYVESCYTALGLDTPKKDGHIDIIKAKGYLVILACSGQIPTFDEWRLLVYGEGHPIWPEDVPWPPWRMSETEWDQTYGRSVS